MSVSSVSADSSTLSLIRRQSIYEEVIQQIKQHIVENRLGPGDRIPTEAEMAERFGVSRLTVREAIKVLESLGVVQTRTRDGMRLRPVTMKPLADHLRFLMDMGEVSVREMGQARQVLECAILPLAIQNATADDLNELDAAVAAFAQAIADPFSAEAIINADMNFHLVLLRSTRNRALESFGAMLQEFFIQVRGGVLSRTEQMENSLRQHRALAEAIRQRDAATAQAVMKEHLRVYDDAEPSSKSRADSTG